MVAVHVHRSCVITTFFKERKPMTDKEETMEEIVFIDSDGGSALRLVACGPFQDSVKYARFDTIEDLKHDIERYIAISGELATENEKLREVIGSVKMKTQGLKGSNPFRIDVLNIIKQTPSINLFEDEKSDKII